MEVSNRVTKTSQQITDQPVTSSSISDDGAFVAFTPLEGIIDFWTDPRQLVRWERSTGQQRVLVTVPEGKVVRSSRISGDGRTIYYTVGAEGDDDGPFEIFRWRDARSTRIALGNLHDVSDDGNSVLLSTGNGPSKDLVLWTNGSSTVLAPGPATGLDNLVRLSGDGRVAVWQRQESSDPDGPASVYRQESGRNAVRIISYPRESQAMAMALSRDGSRLAYVERDDQGDEWEDSFAVFLR
jgi:dipeptidyl aminopeptidase/acylaminoacyl peptidase